MGKQLDIFEPAEQDNKGKICYLCLKNPLSKNGLGIIWNGFRDGDMNVFVCWHCHQKHYTKKQLTEFKNLHSEFPVLYK